MYYLYHIHLEGMRIDEGYIGISKEPKRRWAVHRCYGNTHLKRALKKYKGKIKYSILSSSESVEQILWEENLLRPFPNMGWNILEGGKHIPRNIKVGKDHPNYGRKFSDEVRKKISDSLKGRIRSEEHCKKISQNKSGNKHHAAKPVNIYTKDGTLVAENVTIGEFSRLNGISGSNLHRTMKNEGYTAGGFYARRI